VVVTFLTPFSHTIGLIKLSNAIRTRMEKIAKTGKMPSAVKLSNAIN
jgi:antitoxin component of RelBE/YafQ-DinJ toxin-antitoxin module